jgi:hypothetical protein
MSKEEFYKLLNELNADFKAGNMSPSEYYDAVEILQKKYNVKDVDVEIFPMKGGRGRPLNTPKEIF